MLSLFSTSSKNSGFRLQKVELFNWGTFDGEIYRIEPKGNNALLTGANASGKSTFIDALLTLLVPPQLRSYNQSSGTTKRGDRSTETYVLGYYGKTQEEGKSSSITLKLRQPGNTHSILLATFTNNEEQEITLFYVYKHSISTLTCDHGIALKSLSIEKDLLNINGDWKDRLKKHHQTATVRDMVTFYSTEKAYFEACLDLFGMRSNNAFKLINQFAGIKVLGNPDVFIREHMLTAVDTEEIYLELSNSFNNVLINQETFAKIKAQILYLEPIIEEGPLLAEKEEALSLLNEDVNLAPIWFMKEATRLGMLEQKKLEHDNKQLIEGIEALEHTIENLQNKRDDLNSNIRNNEAGQQLAQLKKEVAFLKQKRDKRKYNRNSYDAYAIKLGLEQNPSEEIFIQNQRNATDRKKAIEVKKQENNIKARELSYHKKNVEDKIRKLSADIEALEKNKSNIPLELAEIRQALANHLNVDIGDLPFVGELVQPKKEISDLEKEFMECGLRDFATHLIVPEKHYDSICQYLNNHQVLTFNYWRYDEYIHMYANHGETLPHSQSEDSLILSLIEHKKDSPYQNWIEGQIIRNYNYSLIELEAFHESKLAVITKQGLMKQSNGLHSKSDLERKGTKRKTVLGWDNKETLMLYKQDRLELQEKFEELKNQIEDIDAETKENEKIESNINEFCFTFQSYESINPSECVLDIHNLELEISKIEQNNNKLAELQRQLIEVDAQLKQEQERQRKQKNDLENNENKIIFVKSFIQEYGTNEEYSHSLNFALFENTYPELKQLSYANFVEQTKDFDRKLERKIHDIASKIERHKFTIEAHIHALFNPPAEISIKHPSWRSEVSNLPTQVSPYFLEEYQQFYSKLKNDDLITTEHELEKFLGEDLINIITSFKMNFKKWEKSIKETIEQLNLSLKEIQFKPEPKPTFIQLKVSSYDNYKVSDFKNLLANTAIQAIQGTDINYLNEHFSQNILPLMEKLKDEKWRKEVMNVRTWFKYRIEEHHQKNPELKPIIHDNMGHLSGGEKAQLTYTILGAAVAYQFGLTKANEGLESKSFRFVAIDEAFKAQDEDKARYLIDLCAKLNLQFLVVTPSDNIHIVQNDISFVHYVERDPTNHRSKLFNLTIKEFFSKQNEYMSYANIAQH